jgi:hypothetical protein
MISRLMAPITLAVSVCLLAGLLETMLPVVRDSDGGSSMVELIDRVLEVSERSPI